MAAPEKNLRCLIRDCGSRIKRKRSALTFRDKLLDTYSEDEIDAGQICKSCYDRLNDRNVGAAAHLGNDDEILVSQLEDRFGGMSDEHRERVAAVAGKLLNPKLRRFAEEQKFLTRSTETLATSTTSHLWETCPLQIRRLIDAITVGAADEAMKVRAVEALCQLVHKNFISPFAFKQATVINSLTNSRTTRDITASALPCGGRDS